MKLVPKSTGGQTSQLGLMFPWTLDYFALQDCYELKRKIPPHGCSQHNNEFVDAIDVFLLEIVGLFVSLYILV